MKPVRALLAALALLALPAGLLAGPADDLIHAEILDGGQTADGTHLAGLRLTLKPGWKTYWRSPGDGGIPPQFSWRGARNLADVVIDWPVPHVFEQSGLRSIGYKGEVVLPLAITPDRAGAPIRLKGSIDLGVCKDICVPERLNFEADLDPGAPRSPAIAAALAERPFSAGEAGVRAARCTVTPTADGVRIVARITMPTAGGPEIAVIEPGNPAIWASEAETSRTGDVLTAQSDLVHMDGAPITIDRSQVRLTVLGSRHAVDIRGCSAG
ncbi:MAG: protein-disulfide reductase DsbD domain-containing protein [Marinibacterium sp.]